MDANGQRFWMVAEEGHWHPTDATRRVQFDRARRTLRLLSEREPGRWTANRIDALARLEVVPQSRDAFGTRARWSEAAHAVVATGALPGEVPIYAPPAEDTPTDFLLGHDGVLYVAAAGRVTLHDRRLRRLSEAVGRAGFQAWRMASDPRGGVWVLDRANRRLGRVTGDLWPRQPYGRYSAETFRPLRENPEPPTLRLLDATWPATETAAALAVSPSGRVAILTWAADGAALLRLLDDRERPGDPVRLEGARYPFSLAWVAEDRVAVLLAGVAEAPVYRADPGEASTLPVGDLYPLRDHNGEPFLHGVSLPPHYPTRTGTLPLHHLSLPSYARRGGAMNRVLLDSGSEQTVWHRLYLEAAIPAGCGVEIRVAASDLPAAPVAREEWYPHRFGSAFPPDTSGVPRGSWVPLSSELPFHPGLLCGDAEPDRSGLFTALVQRTGRRVRSLQGRYLWVQAELHGNGLSTPDLAAVRAYGSRFSYVENYLPELYRESVFAPDADDRSAASTPADFLERFLANFEGVLTPLEDRVAHAYLLTDPASAPEEALEWLAGWIGLALDPAHPEERRREMLHAAPELARWRGTYGGLRLALDLATGGGVRGGEIVVLEDYRLRRTFATILGADLADEEDPLLGGIAVSGNSFVGDTLVLGDEHQREFLALFGAGLPRTAREEAAVAAFFDRLAHRVTVLVHQEVEPQDLGLVRRIVDREAPAHVEARVLVASHPFIVGAASLVGVDSYLGRKLPRQPVRVDRSRIGARDFILSPVSLDPRLEGGRDQTFEPPPGRPTADAGPDRLVPLDEPFLLDATRSTAASGRRLDWYRWTRLT